VICQPSNKPQHHENFNNHTWCTGANLTTPLFNKNLIFRKLKFVKNS
jgi:hypothetical protein